MRRALELAARAVGQTSPNPPVGAVLVKRGRIVGEGYHHRAGSAHAEIEALRQAGPAAQEATLYTTLEPCNHTGRTPPCCDAILRVGIAHVVVAIVDPNPRTNGRGIARLRREGVRVTTGVLRQPAQALIAPFEKVMRTGLPWVIAKIGQSLDGKIATVTGESQWITSPAARIVGHRLRSQADAILIGVTTILRDDPRLTVRGARQRVGRPMKVIVDSRLQTPPAAACLSPRSPAPTLIATTVGNRLRQARLRRQGADIVVLPARRGRVPLRRLCRGLARRGIHSVLIEGGGELQAVAFEERLVDRIVWCLAPRIIGGRTAPSSVGGQGIRRLRDSIRLADVQARWIGPDLCVDAAVVYPGRL